MKAKAKQRPRKKVAKKAQLSKRKKRSKSPMNNQASGKKSTNVEGESVSQIRDIIFGQQMADYDERFSELEKSVREEISELKATLTADLRQSVTDLKALVQKEKEASNDRNVARRQLADKLQKVVDDLRK